MHFDSHEENPTIFCQPDPRSQGSSDPIIPNETAGLSGRSNRLDPTCQKKVERRNKFSQCTDISFECSDLLCSKMKKWGNCNRFIKIEAFQCGSCDADIIFPLLWRGITQSDEKWSPFMAYDHSRTAGTLSGPKGIVCAALRTRVTNTVLRH